jgi:hypothetical protein
MPGVVPGVLGFELQEGWVGERTKVRMNDGSPRVVGPSLEDRGFKAFGVGRELTEEFPTISQVSLGAGWAGRFGAYWKAPSTKDPRHDDPSKESGLPVGE